MAWKIIFKYKDGGQIKVSNGQRKLTKELAEHYRGMYAKSSNDGGMVYTTPFKSCKPVPLDDYIKNAEK